MGPHDRPWWLHARLACPTGSPTPDQRCRAAGMSHVRNGGDRGAGGPDGRSEGGRWAVTRRRAEGCGVRAT